MKYESFVTKGSPTPYNKLVVCDKCQSAHWTIDSDRQLYCSSGHGRLREATKQEYADAKKVIVTEYM